MSNNNQPSNNPPVPSGGNPPVPGIMNTVDTFVDTQATRGRVFSSFWDKKKYNEEEDGNIVDALKMSDRRKVIQNFVKILTGKNVPVVFFDGETGATDGEKVYISADSDETTFDVDIGLALHEGSHILLSDFSCTDMTKHMTEECDNYDDCVAYLKSIGINRNYRDTINKLRDMFASENVQKLFKDHKSFVKFNHDMWNWVEDRRIDNHIYTKTPGYRGYYLKLYDKYFMSPIIDLGLESEEYRKKYIQDYAFRVTNLINKRSEVDALPGLDDIIEILDLRNIKRLKNSYDALVTSVDIIEVILEHAVSGGEQYESDESDDENETDGQDDDDSNGSGDQDGDGDSESDSDGDDKDGKKKNRKKLTGKQRKKLKEAIKKQRQFVRGRIKKKQVSEKMKEVLDQIAETDSTLRNVGGDDRCEDEEYVPKTSCVLVRTVTDNYLNSDSCPISSSGTRNHKGVQRLNTQMAVTQGDRYGTILGRKLQIRNEARETKFPNRRTGRLNKRQISQCGYGVETVFETIEISAYKNSLLHISIDASGSMDSGSLSYTGFDCDNNHCKWYRAILCTTAICKAASMVKNLDVSVDLRTTVGGSWTQGGHPVVTVVYDSRKDPYRKVLNHFPYLVAEGLTPEGLVFEALRDFYTPSSAELNSYFLNLSDGMPYFPGEGKTYHGDLAFQHTKRQVDWMQSFGIGVLSYYVGDSADDAPDEFRRMYGNASRFIDVSNMGQIATTLNKKFLEL